MGVDNRDWSFTVIERGEGLRAAIVSARDGHAEISAAAPVSYRRGELPNAYVVADDAEVAASMPMAAENLRIVLDIFWGLYAKAGWPGVAFPEWMGVPEKPAARPAHLN